MAKWITKYMNKPNFKELSLNELRHYIVAHKKDREAWDEYVSRPRPNAVGLPYTENFQEVEDSLRKLLESKKN